MEAAVLLAATLARLLLAASVVLLDDEAYYWVWSKHLAWGYLDHPPGIAVAIAASTAIFGDAPWAIRLPSIVCGLLTALLLTRLAAEWTEDSGSALRSLVVFHAIPMLGVGALIASPDALLGLFWTLALWAGWRAIRGDGRYWLVAGICVGLGLESKYTMALLVPALLVFGISHTRRRPALRFAATALALALWTPNLLWNATHGWATFTYAIARAPWIAPRDPLTNLVVYATALLVYLSPILGVLVLAAPWCTRPTQRGSFLRWAAAPTVVLVLAAALFGKAKPHYMLPAALVGILALAPCPSPSIHRWIRIGAWAGAAISLTVAALGLLRPPFVPDLHGWPEVAARVRSLVGNRPTVLVATTYQDGAQLSYATRNRYPVTVLPGQHAFTQWSPPDQWGGQEALWVYDARRPPPVRIARWCQGVVPLPPLRIQIEGRVVRTFEFVRCGRFMPGPGAWGP